MAVVIRGIFIVIIRAAIVVVIVLILVRRNDGLQSFNFRFVVIPSVFLSIRRKTGKGGRQCYEFTKLRNSKFMNLQNYEIPNL